MAKYLILSMILLGCVTKTKYVAIPISNTCNKPVIEYCKKHMSKKECLVTLVLNINNLDKYSKCLEKIIKNSSK